MCLTNVKHIIPYSDLSYPGVVKMEPNLFLPITRMRCEGSAFPHRIFVPVSAYQTLLKSSLHMAILLLHINWHVYFTALFFLLALYWLLILFFLYNKETRLIVHRAGGFVHAKAAMVSEAPRGAERAAQQTSLFMEDPSDAELEAERLELDRKRLVYQLSEEVTQYIEEAGVKKTIREEMIQGIRSMIRRPVFKPVWDPGVRVLLNNLIRSEIEQHCGMAMSAEDVRTLWVD